LRQNKKKRDAQIKRRIELLMFILSEEIHHLKMRALGYENKYHEPIMCKCGCKALVYTNKDYLDGIGSILCEADIQCEKCKLIVGHYAYGYEQSYL